MRGDKKKSQSSGYFRKKERKKTKVFLMVDGDGKRRKVDNNLCMSFPGWSFEVVSMKEKCIWTGTGASVARANSISRNYVYSTNTREGAVEGFRQ